MSKPEKVARPLVAIQTRWQGRQGYLHVSEEYSFVQFHPGLGIVREVDMAYLSGRLLELAPRCPILQEASFSCGACDDWHPVGKDCAARRPPRRAGPPERQLPVPPRRLLEIDAGPVAQPVMEAAPAPAHLHIVPPPEKDPAAVALGRRGGLKGGVQRMAALSPEERTALGKIAAAARWHNPKPGESPTAARREVARSRKTSRMIEHNGQTRSLAEWAEVAGLPYHVLTRRLEVGWPLARAIETPKGERLSRPKETTAPAAAVRADVPPQPMSRGPFVVRPDGSIECHSVEDAVLLAECLRAKHGTPFKKEGA